jgi:hypothetical protein
MKNAVLRDVAPCGFIISRRFGGTYRPQLQDRRNMRARKSVRRLLTDRLQFGERNLGRGGVAVGLFEVRSTALDCM